LKETRGRGGLNQLLKCRNEGWFTYNRKWSEAKSEKDIFRIFIRSGGTQIKWGPPDLMFMDIGKNIVSARKKVGGFGNITMEGEGQI